LIDKIYQLAAFLFGEIMAKRGQPSKLESISLDQVEKLAGFGLTDQEIADILGICKATLNNYKNNPKFLDSLKKGKDKADNYVIGSLFHRALGYTHPEVQLHSYKGKIIKTEVLKHYPPDTVAAIFWLKNRQPDKWRDKREVEGQINFHFTKKQREKKFDWLSDFVRQNN